MSYLVAVPDIFAASAGDLANIGAALSAANAAQSRLRQPL